MPLFSSWHDLVLPALILLHLYLAPYTKVEESFNIQAVHDILKYGVPFTNANAQFKALFDHMTFSGSVPRTFVGAIVVAGLSKPISWLRGLEGMSEQITVRAVLGLLNAFAMMNLAGSIRRAYGSRTARWYLFFQASQFHIFFYASRTLPNMFAFCLSTFATAYFLPDPTIARSIRGRRLRRAFSLLTIAAIVFRSEIVLLIASHAFHEILKSGGINGAFALTSRVLIPSVFIAGMASIVVSGAIDTYFWQSPLPLLPELAAFRFNVLAKDHQGASAWGTSPWHWYFTSALPRLIPGVPVLLLPYGLLSTQRKAVLNNSVPPILYTAIYSILAHKETRFLFPIVPQLTLATAISASHLSIRREQWTKAVIILTGLSTILTGLTSHAILLPLSAQNYPGGVALQALHSSYPTSSAYFHNTQTAKPTLHPQIHVHLTNLALQSGVTRFLEHPSSSRTNIHDPSQGKPPSHQPVWLYDKTQTSNTTPPSFYTPFDYLIVEPQTAISVSSTGTQWTRVASVPALRRGRPRILTPSASRGCLVLSCRGDAAKEENGDGDGDGLYELFRAIYGEEIAWGYGVVHDVFREGYGVGTSLTRGYWVDWGLEERLVVLRKEGGGEGSR